MAISPSSRSRTNWIHWTKHPSVSSTTGVVFVVFLVVFMALAVILMKLSIPFVYEFLVYAVPELRNALRSWLTPPFIYVVINGIIAVIVLSSRFQLQLEDQRPAPVRINQVSDLRPPEYNRVVVVKNSAKSMPPETLEMTVYDPSDARARNARSFLIASEEENDRENDYNEANSSRSSKRLINRTNSMEIPPEKSLSVETIPVSGKVGHRKSVSNIFEAGKALDTLESTWKMITEGRSMTLGRDLRKSDTWKAQEGLGESVPQLKRAETFKQLEDSVRHRGEPWLSQDELNRRAEAFIKKFNEEMRLQREESLKQYLEMINCETDE